MNNEQLTLDSFFRQKRSEPALSDHKKVAVVEKNVEPEVFSVSSLNKQIRNSLESGFSTIWLKGEVSNFKPHSSGHHYFSLKDEKSQISAVMFKAFNQGLKFSPKDGLEVLVRGKITVYEPRGNYQIFCESMELVGQGDLHVQFEKLKSKLESEGLFDKTRKKPLPKWPRRIGIVTSPTGAAIRDMLHILFRRYRGAEVLLCPAIVQGSQAPAEIVAGIEAINRLNDVDVLIVGRGGGSIEDLWGFNDEKVARAIAKSRIPTISAVGHEIDFTIADFVADVRAPTPSAAAEIVVPNTEDIVKLISLKSRQLQNAVVKKISYEKQNLFGLQKSLVDPKVKLRTFVQKRDELVLRLEAAVRRQIDQEKANLLLCDEKLGDPVRWIAPRRSAVDYIFEKLRTSFEHSAELKFNKIASLSSMLDSLSPLRVLDRGYTVVKGSKGYIKSVKSLGTSQDIEIQFFDGFAKAQVTEIKAGV